MLLVLGFENGKDGKDLYSFDADLPTKIAESLPEISSKMQCFSEISNLRNVVSCML